MFSKKRLKPQGKQGLLLRCRSDFVSNIRLKVTLTVGSNRWIFLFEIKSSQFDCSEQRPIYPGEKRYKILLMFIPAA